MNVHRSPLSMIVRIHHKMMAAFYTYHFKPCAQKRFLHLFPGYSRKFGHAATSTSSRKTSTTLNIVPSNCEMAQDRARQKMISFTVTDTEDAAAVKEALMACVERKKGSYRVKRQQLTSKNLYFIALPCHVKHFS
jgi:hypothetical protein